MRAAILVSILLLAPSAFAQNKEPNIHSSTTLGSQSRFEIVQSTLAAKWTFRVDKSCGYVTQMVVTKDDGLAWQPMIVFGLPKCPNDGKNRYQVFTSGLAARHTFLMNTDTGKSWQMQSYKDKLGEEATGWFLFEE